MTQEPERPKSIAAFSVNSHTKSESHLQSHVHLTNNVHLHNLCHMQKPRVLMEAPISSELPLMKELTMLRRARSLRDPSTSPAWSNSSYGSRKTQGNGHINSSSTKRDEGRESKKNLKKLNLRGGESAASRREKLDLRAGGHHWVGEFLGEEAADLQSACCMGSDQKENHHILKSNGMDEYHNLKVREDRETTKSGKGVSANGKKGRRLEKSRSYPRLAHPEVDDEKSQKSEKSQRRGSRASTEQHSELENMADGSILGEKIVPEDERLQRGSVRTIENGYVEDPGRRAEIARRVISETRSSDVAGPGGREGSDTRFSSPLFVPKASTAAAAVAAAALSHSRREHLDLIAGVSGAEHEGERDGPEDFGETGEEEEEEEDVISLRHGLKPLPSSRSSHTHSPLLYRDSMTTTGIPSERSTPGRRRKSGSKGSGSRDGERSRHREGINIRVAGKGQRRLKNRRSNLRPGLASNAHGGGGSSFSMDGELDVSELPRNGCGIPWNWNRIQKYRGRKFLDLAGRSLTCGITEGPNSKRKDEINSHSSNTKLGGGESHQSSKHQQSRLNSHRDSAQSDLPSLSLSRSSRGYGERSSDFDPSSRHFESHDGGESPEVPRADGNLLTADRSGELAFGSTREDLSGILVPTSSTFGDELSAGLPISALEAAEEPSRSLSQKYRPRSFSDLVGQSMVTKSLSAAISRGKIAPVYLFQGPRGTGKSSAAKIFAQALNCVSDASNAGVARPCGVCAECTNPSPEIKEFDATSDVGRDGNGMKVLLADMLPAPSISRCRVFIIDDCHCLTAEAWNVFLKALEKTPWHLVFILITTDADKVPRAAISRCQKFLFSKVKEVEIVHRLQSLATREGLEVEESALALVASRSQGSLRDAETVLDQLTLLGRKVSLSIVQEMVGLVSDEKLIELLDLAMSAEAVSTVRCMRELLDGGVEPLGLVSQLATLITDILAGTFIVPRDKLNRGFFFRRSSKKEEAVRLRQALKILSEAEKQLRLSSDQPTWLTAALLQFAPDRSFQPSSLETSVMASPVAGFNDTSEKETAGNSVQPWTSEEQIMFHPEASAIKGGGRGGGGGGGLSSRRELLLQHGYPLVYPDKRKKASTMGSYAEAKVHPAESPAMCGLESPDERGGSGRPSNARSDTPLLPGSIDDLSQRDFTVMSQRRLEEVWQRVLHGSRSNVLRQLLQGQGKLLSLLLSDAFAVAHLEFRQPEHKARAERSRSRICNAFQMALGCPVELQITLACMPAGEQQLSFTSFEDQTAPLTQQFDGWHQKEKSKTPDRRSHESKSTAQNRRRQRSRVQRQAESMDVSQSLYNAVLGDSKGFKPEILPVVSSNRWGKHGGPISGGTGSIHEEDRRSERTPVAGGGGSARETRSFAGTRELRHLENPRIRYGPALLSRSTPGKVPLRTVIHQYDDNVISPNHPERPAAVMCGSASRMKSVKFKDVNAGAGHLANLEQENVRLEPRLKSSTPPVESRLLCWRMQKLDEERIKVQRRRRHRRDVAQSGNSPLWTSMTSVGRNSCLARVRDKMRVSADRNPVSLHPREIARRKGQLHRDSPTNKRIVSIDDYRSTPVVTLRSNKSRLQPDESFVSFRPRGDIIEEIALDDRSWRLRCDSFSGSSENSLRSIGI